MLRKEVNRDGLVAVAGIRIVVPARQLRGRVAAEVLLVRVVERVVVLGVAPRNGHGCLNIREFKTVLKIKVWNPKGALLIRGLVFDLVSQISSLGDAIGVIGA